MKVFNKKEWIDNTLIMLGVSFVMSIVCLNYLVDHDIMNYGQMLHGGQTIFGFYLSQMGWIVFLSLIMSFVSTFVSTFSYVVILVLIKLLVSIFNYVRLRIKCISR